MSANAGDFLPAEVCAEVRQRLLRAESEHGVRILFAIESGSRAWGFASPDSDYDVRFIYAHEPSWYQAVDLEERRDVIEYPIVDDIDLNGWDVRKALRLFWRSNPAFVEWIQSPITYFERGAFRANALAALPEVYSAEKGAHHYRSMTRTTYRTYLRAPMVKSKKYFYALRPLLAARWIERTGAAPPIEFDRLLGWLEGRDEILAEIARLLELKRGAPEAGQTAPIPLLNELIENYLDEAPIGLSRKRGAPETIARLNELFHEVLRESAPAD